MGSVERLLDIIDAVKQYTGEDINYIARNEDGTLYGFVNKPYKKGSGWGVKEGYYIEIDNLGQDFKDKIFGDKKAVEVRELI